MQQALPPPELVEEVVPLITKEAPPNLPEEQSPTLMVEGVMGELASEVEAIEARGIKEEEELSSTSGMKDIKAMM